jgi:hypothetical protein
MHSDMLIPRSTDIIARALDAKDSADRLDETQAAGQIDRLIAALTSGARMCWQLGTLVVTSPSGHTYHVTRAGCDCANGKRCGKRACWHITLFGILEDMFETEVETRDMQCDPPPPEPCPLGGEEGDSVPARSPWYARAAVARAGCWANL